MCCCAKICTSFVRQQIGAAGAGHGALALGVLLTWSILEIPDLLQTENDSSWITIANIAWLGALLAVLPTGFAVDKFGRRIPLILFAIPLLVGWILMSVANNVGLLCLGRFLAGISGGAFSVIVPIYLSEIAETRLRGALMYSYTQHLFMGALLVLFMGKMQEWGWRVLGYKTLPIVIVLFIAGYFLPESPRYLFYIGENGRGSDALKWFRTTTAAESVEAEIKQIDLRLASITSNDIKKSQKTILKQVGIPAFLMLMQQLSCGGHYIFGIMSISDVIAGKTMSSNSVSLVITITAVVTVMFTSNIVDRVARRPLLIISCVLMSLSLFVLGCCIYIQTGESDAILDKLRWIRLISFATYISAYAFGLGPISWLIMVELVPDEQKGFWVSVVTIFNWLPAFMLGKYFFLFFNVVTLYVFLWLCGMICIIAALFSYLFVPETCKRTLIEIQEFFEASHNS